MSKKSEFRKALKLAKKVSKHAFCHMDLKSRTEAYDYWQGEGITKRLIKSVHKDNRGQSLNVV